MALNLICYNNPLLALSLLLITGFILGALAQKIKLPSLIGYIAAGILIGPFCCNLIDAKMSHDFSPITEFALSLFGFTLGTHLIMRKLHNAGKRISYILLCEILLVPLIIFLALLLFTDTPLPMTLLLSAIGLTTSPSSIIHIITQKRAKGVFTKTLVSAVALNNIAAVILFSLVLNIAAALMKQNSSLTVTELIAAPAIQILGSIALGTGVALILLLFTRKSSSLTFHFSILIVAILFLTGIASTLQMPGFLSCMVLGFVVSNYSTRKHLLLKSFNNIEPGIYVLFFVLAGAHMDFSMAHKAGIAGIVFILARGLGKFLAPTLGAKLSHSSKNIQRWIGFALMPQAGVSIGFVMIVGNNPLFAEFANELTTIVLGAVVLYEILGPILADTALKKSGEENKDRARLLDFLHEEYILVGLNSADKWKALEELARFMHRVHGIREVTVSELIESVTAREKQMSTALGEGVAVPHAIIEGGPKIRGVIGISQQGIDFHALDEKPINLIVLIATPQAHYDQHIQVLASIAKIFGKDPELREQMNKASSPAEAHDLLQTGSADLHNVYLDD